jgi:3-keto-disaccharide hydrolase
MRLICGLIVAGCVLSAGVLRAEDAPKPDKDGFYQLFDGKSLDGWKVGTNAATFKVEDGLLVANGKGPAHLFYVGPVNNHDFKNFHLRAEVKTFPKANSGIYFHTEYQETNWPNKGFEAQVNATHSDRKKTGGLYSVQDVMDNAPNKDGEWFVYEIIVQDKHVTLKIDGKTTADWTQPDDWKGPPNMPGRVLDHGTIAIQGHDPGSKVQYKSVAIKPL